MKKYYFIPIICISLIILALLACDVTSTPPSPGGGNGSISIETPLEGDDVTGIITVSGHSSLVEAMIVSIDNDSYSLKEVAPSHGYWECSFDTTRFQDGSHILVAYASAEVKDQIIFTTSNGNLDGYTVTVPVDLAEGFYDEIDSYTPLYVYVKRVTTGLIQGARFFSGTFPGNFDIPNVLNGLYEVGAILDVNGDMELDAVDLSGTATDIMSVNNGNITSGQVLLKGYDIEITSPEHLDVITGDSVTLSGTYSSFPESITVCMDKTFGHPAKVEIPASFGNGYWIASLDITEVSNGTRNVIAIADFGLIERSASIHLVVDRTGGDDDLGENGDDPPDHLFGTIGINSPSNDDVVSGTIKIEGGCTGNFDTIYVEIDNNLFTRHTAGVSFSNWSCNFDTTLLQDGEHIIRAYANDEIYDIVSVTSVNENHQGYTVTVPISLDGVYDDFSIFKPLYVFVKDPATGAKIFETYTEGNWFDTVFTIPNIPNGTYEVGAFLDRNTSMMYDDGDYRGFANDLLDVWYEDITSGEVVLRGYEVRITTPDDYDEFTGNSIHLEGDYTFLPDSIVVSIAKYFGRYERIEAGASLSGGLDGTWTADLDITEVVGNGTRWVTVEAKYGIKNAWDSVLVTLNRTEDPLSIEFVFPEDGDIIAGDSLTVTGTYTEDPTAIEVTLETDTGNLDASVTYATNMWTAEFSDISSLPNGYAAINAKATYSGPVYRYDEVVVIIDRQEVPEEIQIMDPEEGEEITGNDLYVTGIYSGDPESITVSIDTGSGDLDAVVSYGSRVWSAVFSDISGVENGNRVITATADFGGGITDTDTVTVLINRLSPNSFTYRFEVESSEDVALQISYWDENDDFRDFINNAALPWSYDGGPVEIPFINNDNIEIDYRRLGMEVSVHWSAPSSPGYYLDLTISVNGSEFHSKRITDFYNGRIEIQASLDAGQNIVFSIGD